MPTIQEIAKRNELGAGATNVDARKALTATPTAPVATPAPTPATPATPTPATVNVQQQMAGKTVAERQAIRSGQPAPVAPVDQNTGLSKPLETTTPATPTPTPTETQTPFQQAQAESEKIKAQNEAQMKLNTQQADLKAQERQQVAQEIIKANTPVNQKDVLNALVSGVSVAPQNTQAYRNAQMQYKNYQKFATMTPTQLVDNMKMGEIGTETAQLLASNPSYIKAKEDFDKFQKNQSINNMIKSVAEGATGKTTAVDHYQNASDSIAKKLGINETNADAFARIVSQDPETLQLTKIVSSIARQLNDLNTQRNDAYADLKKQYPDMSASALMTLMSNRTKGATDEINALNSSLSLTQADLKMAMEMAQGEYEATGKDIAMQAQLAGENRQMKNQLALSQAQFDQKVAQQAQTMGTPELAIPSVIEQYASQGIFAQKSAQQHIADAKALIAKGGTLGEYISQMQNDFQEKDAYKAKFTGNLNDTQKLLMQQEIENKRDTRNFEQQKELAILNKDLGRQEFLWQIENDPEKKAKALELEQKLNANKSLFDVLGKNVGTYEGNRGYDLAGAIGDPLPAGGNWTVKSIDTAGEQVGSIFIGGKSKKPYGNTVVMQDENGNEIRYSHLQDIGVKPGDVLGFGDIVGTRGNTGNVKGANGEILTAEQLKAGRGAHLDIEIKSGGKLLSNADQVNFLKGLTAGGGYSEPDITIFNSMSPTDKKKSQNDPAYRAFLSDYTKTMKDKNAPLEDILKFSSGQNKMGDAESKSLDKFSQALGQISGIQEQISKMDTGPILGRLRNLNPYDTDAQVLKASLQALIPNLARGVYGEVGVLTDADIENYAKTIPNLKSTQDVNNAILAMTLQTMGTGYKSQLQSLASAKNDVSGYGGLYNQYMDIVNQLKSQNTGTQQTNTMDAEFDSLYNGL